LPTPERRTADPDAVFGALGDPTRRRLVELLAGGAGAATATTLSAALPISRQAVTKHLGILAEARLVSRRRSGREARYELDPEALAEAERWLQDVGAAWDRRLSRLRGLLED
jgi:ArsR family transcriptional regulator, cadmium/lead-responsive transcriptional repressor